MLLSNVFHYKLQSLRTHRLKKLDCIMNKLIAVLKTDLKCKHGLSALRKICLNNGNENYI